MYDKGISSALEVHRVTVIIWENRRHETISRENYGLSFNTNDLQKGISLTILYKLWQEDTLDSFFSVQQALLENNSRNLNSTSAEKLTLCFILLLSEGLDKYVV